MPAEHCFLIFIKRNEMMNPVPIVKSEMFTSSSFVSKYG